MGQKFTSDKPSIEEILRLKNKHTLSVDILIDTKLASEIKALERQHIIELRVDSKENRTPVAPGLWKQIEKLTEEAQESTVTFTFRDQGRKRFEDLWKTCPPSDEQRELGFEWDPDAFGPLVIAESCIEPKLTLEEATQMYDEWSTAEAETLLMTAINVNMGMSAIPLSGTATGGQPTLDLSSIIATNEESPTDTT